MVDKFSINNYKEKERHEKKLKEIAKILQHPIRVRMLGILRNGKTYTQREIGRELSLSNAAIHYHLKVLVEAKLVKLIDTRQGPNSITEKLYSADEDELAAFAEVTSEQNTDIDFYLDYTLSWIIERNREGGELIKESKYTRPFLSGSYVVTAPLGEINKFKKELNDLVSKFHDKYQDNEDHESEHFSVTFSVLPAKSAGGENSRNVLEYEPDLNIEE